MKFVDDVKIWVKSGDGGNGCVSFRREKFVPRGGPDGGDGGHGGDVVFITSTHISTLLDYLYRPHNIAGKGGHGQGAKKHGRTGKDIVVKVPVGTLLKDCETGEVLYDLSEPGQKIVFLQGGRGGKGNSRFTSPTRRSPRHAEKGEPGKEQWVRLELKIMADVGLVGLPNAGKSTLLGKLTAARPKIADYPFTTLFPNLGVITTDSGEPFTIADIPGLIRDAHKGSGLGIRFLKHIERTKLLLHIIDAEQLLDDDPFEPFRIVRDELDQYSPKLSQKPYLVGFNKVDLVNSPARRAALETAYRQKGIDVVMFSALTGENTGKLIQVLERFLFRNEVDRSADSEN